MPRPGPIALAVLLALTPGGADAVRVRDGGALAPHAHRGVCWVGGANREGMARLVDLGVRWISITPFAYGQREKHKPPPGGFQASTRRNGESVEDARAITQLAHEVGLRVMLKPHVWFERPGLWHGDIAMENDADWKAWFDAYSRFLEPFVAVAREAHVDAFCLGTELPGTTAARPDLWRQLIGWVREGYAGPLTYASHWDQEFERIPFWEDLDWIGVNSYFPLTDDPAPSVDKLVEGWEPWVARLAAVARRTGRPVVFPEMGYKPVVGTAIKPWEWRERAEASPPAQADAYEAFFRAVASREWFHGCYVWKWFARSPQESGGRRRQDFSPQGLPGQDVMARWFRAGSPPATRPAARATTRPSRDR